MQTPRDRPPPDSIVAIMTQHVIDFLKSDSGRFTVSIGALFAMYRMKSHVTRHAWQYAIGSAALLAYGLPSVAGFNAVLDEWIEAEWWPRAGDLLFREYESRRSSTGVSKFLGKILGQGAEEPQRAELKKRLKSIILEREKHMWELGLARVMTVNIGSSAQPRSILFLGSAMSGWTVIGKPQLADTSILDDVVPRAEATR